MIGLSLVAGTVYPFIVYILIINTVKVVDQYKSECNDIVTVAEDQIGVPYSWGAGDLDGPSRGHWKSDGIFTTGFDCSGLTRYCVYNATGLQIQRTAADQLEDDSCALKSFEERRAGDLIYYKNEYNRTYHTGIVAKNIDNYIHAPGSGMLIQEAPIKPHRWDWIRRCYRTQQKIQKCTQLLDKAFDNLDKLKTIPALSDSVQGISDVQNQLMKLKQSFIDKSKVQ